jgi:hypothetical protein
MLEAATPSDLVPTELVDMFAPAIAERIPSPKPIALDAGVEVAGDGVGEGEVVDILLLSSISFENLVSFFFSSFCFFL